jgi:antitoxin component of MazEF toxin-antitoxin module
MSGKSPFVRKVNKSGGSYTVTLPRDWAEQHGIDDNTELGMDTDADGNLVYEAPE